jgi:hypothetical protein
MNEPKKAEPCVNGEEMWRDYAASYGVITARIICHRYLNNKQRKFGGAGILRAIARRYGFSIESR